MKNPSGGGIPPAEQCLAMFEAICERRKIIAALTDADGLIVWTNKIAESQLPGVFTSGVSFEAVLDRVSCPAQEFRDPQIPDENNAGELRCLVRENGQEVFYHYVRQSLPGADRVLHALVDVSGRKQFEEFFALNLHQLRSMKEIVDILYESISTQEVIYLILVAMTAQMGFGFNRAFFLEVRGGRLRGKIGIGPCSPEEAEQIWSRMSARNFSSLRDIYQNLIGSIDVPDAMAQELSQRIDLDLSPLDEGRAEGALLSSLANMKPARLQSCEASSEQDRELFRLLGVDEAGAVPLSVRGSLAGVLIADNIITRKPISEHDLNVFKSFAGYAGVALERSSLYDELRGHVDELKGANSRLKAHQEKLVQAEKLSALGEMAAYVSHEVRNPLVAVGGLARSLLRDQSLAPRTAENLNVIVTEVERVERFLRDGLDFVRPRTARTVETQLNREVAEALAPFRQEFLQRNIGLEFEPEPNDGQVVGELDPDLLRHALSNLLQNALEAVTEAGQIRVQVRRHGPSASIQVADTGAGIPLDVRQRIFDPFFSTKAAGTGLGLAIVAQCVRQLRGKLELEDEPPFGTAFRITLPLESDGSRFRESEVCVGEGKEATWS